MWQICVRGNVYHPESHVLNVSSLSRIMISYVSDSNVQILLLCVLETRPVGATNPAVKPGFTILKAAHNPVSHERLLGESSFS